MKTLFIPAESDVEIKLDRSVIARLKNKKIGLVTTIQHLHKLKDVKKQLKGSVIAGQILGCDASSAEEIKEKIDAFLFVGTGRFHPIQVAEKIGKTTYTYNPMTKVLSKVEKEMIEKLRRRKKGAYLKYLTSDIIGILVSTKSGQNRFKEAKKLHDQLKKDNKNPYILMFETLDINQLENFPFIQCYVNTACPRIFEDSQKPMINIEDVR